MSAFGKEAGPKAPPLSQPLFGNNQRPLAPSSSLPPPSLPHYSPARSPRGPEYRAWSPPLAPETSGLAASSYQSSGIPRSTEVLAVQSPLLAFESTQPGASPAYSSVRVQRLTESPPVWANEQRSFFKGDTQTNPRPSLVTSFVASRNSGTSITAKVARFQGLKWTRTPPSQSINENMPRNPNQTFLQRPAVSQHFVGNQPKLPENLPNLVAHHDQFSSLPYDSERRFENEGAEVHAPKRTRSPLADEVLHESTYFDQKESKRPSVSPARMGTSSNALFIADSQISQRPLPSVNISASRDTLTRATGFSMAKRIKSPPLPSDDEVLLGNSFSTQDGTEREEQAKAKRLARFKEELSESFENSPPNMADQKLSFSGTGQSMVDRQKISVDKSKESATDGNVSSNFEGLETSTVIVGLCPDMCPESERAERERKGDLDQYERLDGDRNQTNKFLAVKKYNRTAEREANLIRPMPILQKTIDYLLSLLDESYDDSFLGLYNFLWDRMRAIRMDLRMQHIFNQESITMLEQMIRLHVIAMHELCEYSKGEGFSEGFDAHLNIEQMNKTSVELFQMYDDHRKKGINVPTEKEYRGYYALLKLDKHPGYKVEPAELSLELAKMTPEIRQTPEVLFARAVARACRTGNFIAFFRLARNASFLQACLMHAHFAKLRTHALASLHSGLQNNQGLPVSHVSKWLAMEEEDVQSLLEYHGFVIKEFEEPYMVKEGPFLNGDKDYPTKCSKLVQQKKSRRIMEDVSSTFKMASLPAEATKDIPVPDKYKNDKKACPAFEGRKSSVPEIDEEMPDIGPASSPKVGIRVQPVIEKSIVDQPSQHEHYLLGVHASPRDFSLAHSSPKSQPARVIEKQNHGSVSTSPKSQPARILEKQNLNALFSSPKSKAARVMEKQSDDVVFTGPSEQNIVADMEPMLSQIESRNILHESSTSEYGYTMHSSVPQKLLANNSKMQEPPDVDEENADKIMGNYEDEEVAEAKIKLIIRKWRLRALKRRELREQRQVAANAALTSLSLGPPVQQTEDLRRTACKFDIDYVMRERYEKHEKSWSRLNVSDAVADILGRRNPSAKCLCWKIILCLQDKNQGDKVGKGNRDMHIAAGSWLHAKLMPSIEEDCGMDGDLLISSHGMSIWRRWVFSQSGDKTCCLSVVKDVRFDDLNEIVAGASAILFLISLSIPWNLQKAQLHNLLKSIPPGSCLPLLILSDSYNKDGSEQSSIVNQLGLLDIDRSRVSSYFVIFLAGDEQMGHLDGFFSDMRLRQGLQWLASESPLQPDIHCTKTRELILTHLNPSMDALEKMNDYEVGPDLCISAFNEALDWSMGEISAAAKANPASWPCPEIALVDDFSHDNMIVTWHLPSLRWSSAARIEPLLCTIKNCKLPSFPDSLSWLGNGADMGNEIENLRSQLENWLISYLTQISQMMGFPLASKEAQVMLQRNSRLELHDSSYCIVPKWTKIFRRIFSWRLAGLSNGNFSLTYVLRQHHVDQTSQNLGIVGLERTLTSPYLSLPSLDEIIEIGCSPVVVGKGQTQAEAFPLQARTISSIDDVTVNLNDSMEHKRISAPDVALIARDDHVTDELNGRSTESVVEADKLSNLLEQCNILQNLIDKKLYIYF